MSEAKQVSGMIDDVIIANGNLVRIPDAQDFRYQTIEIEGVHGDLVIDVDGRLELRPLPGREMSAITGYCKAAEEKAAALLAGTYCCEAFDLYGNDVNNFWWELELKIVNNQVVRVKGYNDVLFEKVEPKVVQPMPPLANHDHGGNIRVNPEWLVWYKEITGCTDDEAAYQGSLSIGSVQNAMSVQRQVEQLIRMR